MCDRAELTKTLSDRNKQPHSLAVLLLSLVTLRETPKSKDSGVEYSHSITADLPTVGLLSHLTCLSQF